MLDSLEMEHAPRGPDLVDEILRQYGLSLRKDEQDFYQEHMGRVFDRHVEYVKTLLQGFKYDHLYNLSRVGAN